MKKPNNLYRNETKRKEITIMAMIKFNLKMMDEYFTDEVDIEASLLYMFCACMAAERITNIVLSDGKELNINNGQFFTSIEQIESFVDSISGNKDKTEKYLSQMEKDGLLKIEEYGIGVDKGLIITVCNFDDMICDDEE